MNVVSMSFCKEDPDDSAKEVSEKPALDKVTTTSSKQDKSNLLFVKSILGIMTLLVTSYSIFSMYIRYEELQLLKQYPDQYELRFKP